LDRRFADFPPSNISGARSMTARSLAHVYARRAVLTAFCALGLGAVAVRAQAEELRVAVAANFTAPMKQIAADFTAETGQEVKLSFGSTGKFYSQIVNGAPFEVLLAADDATPKKLLAEGQAIAGTAYTYAMGKLVLWSPKAGLVDDQGKVLSDPSKFAHLSIANPKLAPYGQAAMEAIESRGLTAALTPKLVTAESIAQAYQFASTGNAELGFVAMSQVSVPGKPAEGSMWVVPSALYKPIRQDAVLLKLGEGNTVAQKLLSYLKGPKARAVIESYGYGL